MPEPWNRQHGNSGTKLIVVGLFNSPTTIIGRQHIAQPSDFGAISFTTNKPPTYNQGGLFGMPRKDIKIYQAALRKVIILCYNATRNIWKYFEMPMGQG